MAGEINFGLADPNAVTQGFANTNAMLDSYTQRQAGQQLATGDTQGAEDTLNQQGMLPQAQAVQTNANNQDTHDQQVQDHLQSLSDKQRADRAQFIGDVATTMQNVRVAHGDAALMPAYDQLAPVFQAQGVPPDQIAMMRQQLAANPDVFLDGMIQHATKEGFTLGPQQQRFDSTGKLLASNTDAPPHYQLIKNGDGSESLVAVDQNNVPIPGAPPPPVGAQPGQPAAPTMITPNVVWTHMQEAGGNPDGLKAVASVAANRARLGHETLDSVVTDPGQFGYGSPVNSPEHKAFLKIQAEYPVGSSQYQHALETITPILSGQQAPVGPYTHYFSPVAQKQFGREPPSWAQGDGVNIGGNAFYSIPYKGVAPGSSGGPTAAPPTNIQTGTPGVHVLATSAPAPARPYLTPAEVQAAGYRPGTVVQRDPVTQEDKVLQPGDKPGAGGVGKLPPDVQARLKSIYTAMDSSAQLDAMAQDFMHRAHGIQTGGFGYTPVGGSANNPTSGVRATQAYNVLFDHDTAGRIQALDAISNRATPLLRPLGSGRILGQEYTNFGRAFPSTKNFPQANADQAEELHNEAMKVQAHGAFMIHYANTHGTFDGADEAWQAGQGQNNSPTAGVTPGRTGGVHRSWSPQGGLQ